MPAGDGCAVVVMEERTMDADEKMRRLWNLCEHFIYENRIGCAETIFQVDSVAENSPEFIECVCNIVGYSNGD